MKSIKLGLSGLTSSIPTPSGQERKMFRISVVVVVPIDTTSGLLLSVVIVTIPAMHVVTNTTDQIMILKFWCGYELTISNLTLGFDPVLVIYHDIMNHE